MPPVRILSYLTSVLTYTFLISVTYHPDTLYLREQGCEDPWLLFEARRGSHYATNRQVAVSIRDGVIGIFQ